MTTQLLERMREQPLLLRFLAAGAAVMLAAMLLTGAWITARIEQSVVDNTAGATALLIESFVSPLSQELAAADTLSEPAARALAEGFAKAGLGERIVSLKIWKRGGRVVYATDPTLVGQRFTPTAELQRAWAGHVTGSFEALDDPESAGEAALGLPLLEVYSPIREVWSRRGHRRRRGLRGRDPARARPGRRPAHQLALGGRHLRCERADAAPASCAPAGRRSSGSGRCCARS